MTLIVHVHLSVCRYICNITVPLLGDQARKVKRPRAQKMAESDSDSDGPLTVWEYRLLLGCEHP